MSKTKYPMPKRSHVQGTIYLCHLDKPFGHALHYAGWTEGSLENRMELHRKGRGAKLLAAAIKAGIGWKVVRIWKGDRFLERRLKASGHSRRCPVCNQRIRQYDRPEVQD